MLPMVIWFNGKMAAKQKHFEKKDRANELLRYAISVLDGSSGMICTRKGRLELALVMKRDLARMKAWWQVKILEHHIHKWQKENFKQ